jgi:hypothetical protein
MYSFINLANDVGTFCRFEKLEGYTSLGYIFSKVEDVVDCLGYIARYMGDDIHGDLVNGVCKLPLESYDVFLARLLDEAYDINGCDIDGSTYPISMMIETVCNGSEKDLSTIHKQFDDICCLAKIGPLSLRRLNKSLKGVLLLSARVSSNKRDITLIQDRMDFVSRHLEVTIGRTSQIETVQKDMQILIDLQSDLISEISFQNSQLSEKVDKQETLLIKLRTDYMNRHISNDNLVLAMCQFTMFLMGSAVIVCMYMIM